MAGGTIYVGTGDGYEVGAYGPDGTLRSRIRKPHQPVRVRPEDREAFLARVVRVGGTEQDRQERARAMENAPFPETMPPYTSLNMDAAGNLWVREMQPPAAISEISRWSVFDPAGEWIASAQGPARFKVFQIGPDWILGTQTDSTGVEYVRIYRIVKR